MSENTNTILDVRNLRKHFPLRRGVFSRISGWVKAVDDVSFHINAGEVVGLVGESGSGKTTVARTIVRLLRPSAGQIVFEGTDVTEMAESELRPLRRRMQMVFQDPFASLDPRQTVGAAIAEALLIHGLQRHPGGGDRVFDLLHQVGLGAEHASRYPHEFSGGQRQRVGIARALAVEPVLLVADEPVSALDVSVQAQVINLLQDLRADLGLSMLFVAHDLSVVRHISDRVIVMYLGKVMEVASVDSLFDDPKHPYTKALLAAVPTPDPRGRSTRQRSPLAGEVPSPVEPPSGCVFRTRCPIASEECAATVPELRAIGSGEPGQHLVACLKVNGQS